MSNHPDHVWSGSPLSKRTGFVVLLVPFLLAAACDPLAPGAAGRITLSPGANLETGRTLEVRLLPNDGEPFDPSTADFTAGDFQRERSWPVAEVEFPLHYDIGGGLGHSEHERWRVVAWVATSKDAGRPRSGEWYGTRVLRAEDCGVVHSGYCGMTLDVDLVIDLTMDVRLGSVPQRPVQSQLGPNEYIEAEHTSYTMRCHEGPDEARSVGTYVVALYGRDDSKEPASPGPKLAATTAPRDGTIHMCWLTDLDANGNPDALIFSKSAGSGGYANLDVYHFDGRDLQPTVLPDPDPEFLTGYQGRDGYDLTDGVLSRNFPVYLSGDANCCPQGGTRALEYDAANMAWKLSES